jgi:hypothetical protein
MKNRFSASTGKAAIRIAALAGLSLLASGCVYDSEIGLGYASDGYASAYDCDPYSQFDSYYDCDYRYGFSNIGYGGGWYSDYYYPGYGYFIFDNFGRRYRMQDNYLRYWGQRRYDWYRSNNRRSQYGGNGSYDNNQGRQWDYGNRGRGDRDRQDDHHDRDGAGYGHDGRNHDNNNGNNGTPRGERAERFGRADRAGIRDGGFGRRGERGNPPERQQLGQDNAFGQGGGRDEVPAVRPEPTGGGAFAQVPQTGNTSSEPQPEPQNTDRRDNRSFDSGFRRRGESIEVPEPVIREAPPSEPVIFEAPPAIQAEPPAARPEPRERPQGSPRDRFEEAPDTE